MNKGSWLKTITSCADCVRLAALISAVLLFPLRALALESDEFHLFGVTPTGAPFDITPFNEQTAAAGDADSEKGIVGIFYVWEPFGNPKATGEAIGNCRVRNTTTSYSFSCEPGKGRLAGTLYVGEKIDARTLKHYPEAQRLYDAWTKKMEYGDPSAYYRCKQGCTNAIPKSLIFVWYGD